MFARFGVRPPNHWGYVQFGAALLLIFGIMFVQVLPPILVVLAAVLWLKARPRALATVI